MVWLPAYDSLSARVAYIDSISAKLNMNNNKVAVGDNLLAIPPRIVINRSCEDLQNECDRLEKLDNCLEYALSEAATISTRGLVESRPPYRHPHHQHELVTYDAAWTAVRLRYA